MKKLMLLTAALFSASVFAATTSDSFDVSVNLTSACTVKTGANDIAFTYTAFQGTDAVGAPTSVVFQCTRGLATPTVAFDTANGTTSATSATGATAEGVLRGLRYTLSVGGGTSNPGTDASAGAGGTGGSNGTGDEYTYAITSTMPQGQAGATTGVANHARSLIITY